jgi:hypothetical protein
MQGILGVEQYVVKPDALIIPNPERPEGKMSLQIVDLIQSGELKLAEDRLKRYSIELEILTNRMKALLSAQGEDPQNSHLREMIAETDLKLGLYCKH